MSKKIVKLKPLDGKELVERIIKKKMIVNDQDKAREIIENYGYSETIIRYRAPFYNKTNKTYKEGVSFDMFYNIYKFDFKMKMIFFSIISITEERIKSLFSSFVKNELKQFDYMCLTPEIMDLRSIKNNKVYECLIKDSEKRYHNVYGKKWNTNEFQSWKLFDLATFEMLEKYFSLLNKEYKTSLAKLFNLDESEFKNYLIVLGKARNICAHNSNLLFTKGKFVTLKTKSIFSQQIYNALEIELDPNRKIRTYGENDLFSVVIVLKRILNNDDNFKEFCDNISTVLNGFKSNIKSQWIYDVIMENINFPSNWKMIKDIIIEE